VYLHLENCPTYAIAAHHFNIDIHSGIALQMSSCFKRSYIQCQECLCTWQNNNRKEKCVRTEPFAADLLHPKSHAFLTMPSGDA